MRRLAWAGLTCCVLAGEALRHELLLTRGGLALVLVLFTGGAIVATRAYDG